MQQFSCIFFFFFFKERKRQQNCWMSKTLLFIYYNLLFDLWKKTDNRHVFFNNHMWYNIYPVTEREKICKLEHYASTFVLNKIKWKHLWQSTVSKPSISLTHNNTICPCNILMITEWNKYLKNSNSFLRSLCLQLVAIINLLFSQ